MKKLVLLIVTFLFATNATYAHTVTNINFSNFREKAEYFIQSESQNPAWKGYNPTITKETFFYTSNENTPSYIEYKVSCDDMDDCGWIMINIDKSDTSIPIASFAGETMSETLNPENEQNFKFYYFGVLDYFAVNQKNGKLIKIGPDGKVIKNPSNIYYRNNDDQTIKQFNNLKKQAKNNLEANKNNRKVIENQSTLRTANTNSTPKYIGAFNRSNGCSSYTPCYTQGERQYPEGPGFTGCTPTAVSIILGYYDRTSHTNIFSFAAPVNRNANITKIQTEIGNLMGTFYQYNSSLGKGEGSTYTNRNQDGWKYLKGKYNYTSDYHSWWGLVDNIQDEINEKRPAMISIERYVNDERQGHSIVAHGYKGNQIYANFGWGNNTANTILSTDGNDFTSSQWNGKINRVDKITIKK